MARMFLKMCSRLENQLLIFCENFQRKIENNVVNFPGFSRLDPKFVSEKTLRLKTGACSTDLVEKLSAGKRTQLNRKKNGL